MADISHRADRGSDVMGTPDRSWTRHHWIPVTKSQSAIWIERGIVEGLPEYLASRRDLAEAVFSMLSSGDRVGAARAAHKMIGSPGIHGFDEGASFYRTVEALTEFPELSISDAMLRTARDLAGAFASPDVR